MKYLLASSLVLLAVAACGDDGATHNPDAGPPDGSAALAITPPTADVLTCSSVQYATNDPLTPVGAWSADHGTIDATGRYAAPLAVPAGGGGATITYTPSRGSAVHATAMLATALPSAPRTVDTGFTTSSTPYEHVLAARGSRVYAVFPTTGGGGARILRSDDGGASFTAEPTLAIGGLKCVSAAVDAANPDVVYLVEHHTAGTETSVTLHVSEDGGATFPAAKAYTIADSVLDGLVLAICPSVTSPSADRVVVATAAQDSDQTMSWTALYASGSRGASFGTGHGTESGDYYALQDTNRTATFTSGTVLSDAGQYGPRVFTDGAGTVCASYSVDSASGCEGGSCNGIYLQCSANGGGTWSAPHLLDVSGTATFPTGAISASGNVAVTWTARHAGEAEIRFAISHDRGATFGANGVYPFDKATYGYTDAPVVAWQGNDILWLTQTTAASDDPRIVVDKTCDFGTTWSGSVALTAGSDDASEGLLVTARGVAAIASGLRESASYPLALIPLTP